MTDGGACLATVSKLHAGNLLKDCVGAPGLLKVMRYKTPCVAAKGASQEQTYCEATAAAAGAGAAETAGAASSSIMSSSSLKSIASGAFSKICPWLFDGLPLDPPSVCTTEQKFGDCAGATS